MIGRKLAHYEILGKLGSGGMGDVYRARDTILAREVALKILPDEVAADPERRKRFQREAQVVAALKHPNIVTIHSVEEGQSVHFLTMELVEGDTLAALIPVDGLPVEEFFSFGIPLAEAVAAAHEGGVAHRDLKPDNVMIDSKGWLWVLDFGLAKLVAPTAGADPAKTMTMDSHTAEGRILGTAAYMSPEQAEGRPIDHRSDIFSLGVVLYEMATGERPFQGETQISTLSAILKDQPQRLTALKPTLPRHLGRIVGRCLEKDPELRYQSAKDVRNELAGLKEEMDSGELETGSLAAGAAGASAVRRSDRTSSVRWWYFAPLLVAVLLVAVWTKLRPGSEPATERAASYRQVTFSGKVRRAALSADGQWLAYVERGTARTKDVYVQDLNGGTTVRVLDGIEEHYSLQWSPNGAQILVAGTRGGEYGIFVVPRLGGNIAKTRFWGLVDWSPDGTEIVGSYRDGVSPLTVWARGTNTVVSRFTIADSTHWRAAVDWSPAPRILVATRDFVHLKYVVWTVLPDGSEQNRVLETDSAITSLAWASPSGDAFYFQLSRSGSRGDLMKQRLDPKTGLAEGEPTLVEAGIDGYGVVVTDAGRSMVYLEHKEDHDLWLVERDTTQPTGIHEPVRLTSGRHSDMWPALSPDGRTIAFARRGGGEEQVYTIPVSGGRASQVTFLESRTEASSRWDVDEVFMMPAWSPDGRSIAFIAETEGVTKVRTTGATGGDPRVYGGTLTSTGLTWSPGERILFQRPGNRNFSFLDTETEEQVRLLEDETTGWIFLPVYSPDGSTVAVSWNRILDDHRGGMGLWSISLEDGSQNWLAGPTLAFPIGWSEDGEWIYYFDADEDFQGERVLRIPAQGGDPEEHLTIPLDNAVVTDITPDGNRVVLFVEESLSDAWLVENFDSDLQ
ncbi:MAG: protein kinase [bacterium]|nr:protein kinase [bacterium]